MKQLLLILSIALLTASSGMSQNRYSVDEVTIREDFESGQTITFLKSDVTLLNGVVYAAYENGQLEFERNIKEGKRDGLQRRWHKNGQLEYEQNYKDGKPDGLHRWYKNGQLHQEENYKDGYVGEGESGWYKDGLQREWYENGQLREEQNWKDGKLISEKKWDEEGNPK